MPQLDPQGEALLTRTMMADPGFKAIMEDPRYSNPRHRAHALAQYAHQKSLAPADYDVNPNGSANYNEPTNWAQVAALLAIPATLGTVAALAGGGAVAAGGGVGGGIGESAATTGLAGSGFGAAPIGATTVGTAGAGGGMAAAAPSILGNTARNLAPILGNAAGNQANRNAQQEYSQLSRDSLNLQRSRDEQALPGKRLNTSVNASKVKNASPVKANWGGPGSGLRGQKVEFSGGYANPNLIDPRTRSMADDIIMQQLTQQLGREEPPEISGRPQSSFWEKFLGGASMGAGVLGGLRR